MTDVSTMIDPPLTPSDLSTRHVEQYLRSLADGGTAATVTKAAQVMALLFDYAPLDSMIRSEAKAKLRPRSRAKSQSDPGYTDHEYKQILTAAESDVRQMIRRLNGGAPALAPSELELLMATGQISATGVPFTKRSRHQRSVAEQVFVTKRDLIPMMILFVCRTGWNVETIKELPSDHTMLGERAVSLTVLKRRRGVGRWHQPETWEIGRAGRELSAPGSLYLLFHELMAPARAALPGSPYWAVWSGNGRGVKEGIRAPFAQTLNYEEKNSDWVRRHDLKADAAEIEGQTAPPLSLTFPRLKTSVDVRRVRKAGGHLPSAAKSNTIPVLFRNYLAGDPTTLDWAGTVINEAFEDVEQTALAVHRDALRRGGRVSIDVRAIGSPFAGEPDIDLVQPKGTETAWTTCRDHLHHPLTGRRCQQSFLDCFHCANSVVTPDHLPNLMSLIQALEHRRGLMPENAWWQRYGATWAALRHDIVPRFTEAEVEQAIEASDGDGLLDLIEPRWEQP